MQETRCGNNCAFVNSGFCDSDKNCPNYTETIWENAQTGEVRTIGDCSPKRIMIETQRLINSFTSLQRSFEIQRDKIESLESNLSCMIHESRVLLKEVEEGKIKALTNGQ